VVISLFSDGSHLGAQPVEREQIRAGVYRSN
jgi:hypothetical protein